MLQQLKEYLDSRGVKYTVLTHSQAFTAQEIAAVARIPGKELAKTVIMRLDGKLVMVVLPASDMVDFRLLKKAMNADRAELATEGEFRDRFPQCELGAMPPFGNLYDMEVLVAADLQEDKEIAFNAGDHRILVRMAYEDYQRLVSPKVLNLSVPKRSPMEENWKLQV